VWAAARRFSRMSRLGKDCVILHFGDHDPSGLDMTRDIGARIALFNGPDVDVRRLALNMNQVETYQLPENPAKESDSRYTEYCATYGTESSWELDALRPTVLGRMVRDAIDGVVDRIAWDDALHEQAQTRGLLRVVSTRFGDVEKFLRKRWPDDVAAAVNSGNDGLYDEEEDEGDDA